MSPSRRSKVPASAVKMVVFAVVTAVLFGFLATLIGNLSFTSARAFQAVFTDATGVTKGDRVRLSGVEVGHVTGVHLRADGDAQRAQVSFTVDRGVPLRDDAELYLRFENLVGQRYLEIKESAGTGGDEPDGATIPVARTHPALNLTVLFDGFRPLFRALDPRQVNRLAGLIIQAVQGEGPTYASLLASTARLTTTIANRDQVIGQVVDNLGTVLRTVNDRDVQLTRLILTFRDLVGGLAKDRQKISDSLPGLADLLSVSSGYVADVRPPLQGTVTELDAVAGQLDTDRGVLDSTIRALPKRTATLARTGSYGSFFNFYLCGISLRLRILGDDYALTTPSLSANERDTVCGARGSR